MSSKSYVYAIKVKNTNKVKIGVSSRIEQRFKDLQSANPDELELLSYCECPDKQVYQVEAYLHKKFKENNIRCEWFNLSDEIVLSVVNDNLLNLIEYEENEKLRKIVFANYEMVYKGLKAFAYLYNHKLNENELKEAAIIKTIQLYDYSPKILREYGIIDENSHHS